MLPIDGRMTISDDLTIDIDLCHACAQLKLRAFRDRSRRLHHTWHPLLKIARPLITIPPHVRPHFRAMLANLQSLHTDNYMDPLDDEVYGELGVRAAHTHHLLPDSY